MAQIVVEGVSDKGSYTDTASFRVLSETGFQYDVWLNGNPVPLDVDVDVSRSDYYDLNIRRIQEGTGTETSRQVRFIVKSSNRGSTEKGLTEWMPYPLTPSASAEFSGTMLNLMIPQHYPQGLAIPVVARVNDGQDHAVRVNGALAVSGFAESLSLLRGHGSTLLPAATNSTPLALNFNLHALSATKTITLDTNTVWTSLSGTLAGTTTWPTNSRIYLTGDITIPSDAQLVVEAGTVVKLDPLVNIYVDGQLTITGTETNPVVWAATGSVAPEQRGAAWGGFLIRGAVANLQANRTIFLGGGGGHNFDFQSSKSHRSEQPVFFVYDNATAHLSHCAILNTAGQAGNGYRSDIRFDYCLFQKAITMGEYVGSRVEIDNSALIEFPANNNHITPTIAEADYDVLYFSEGTHFVRNTLLGFCKDDTIDSGGGGAGTVVVSNCWIEAALHEGLAWSGTGRETWTTDTVLMNNGQGIECGYSSGSSTPLCQADNILVLNNSVGARFGDNYNWSYNGELQITNSFLLHNHRDVFGRSWNDWNWHTSQMDLQNNFMTTDYPEHPANTRWDSAADGGKLAAFMTTPPEATVGIALAIWTNDFAMTELAAGLPVRLSTFTTNTVEVSYSITDTNAATLATGTLIFNPGETLKRIYATDLVLQNFTELRVQLSAPIHGELTGQTEAIFRGTVSTQNLSLAGVSKPVLLGNRMKEGVFLFLDQPSAGLVSVDYIYAADGQTVEIGTFVFDPPATSQSIMPQQINPFDYPSLDLTLSNPIGAVLTGMTSASFTNPPLSVYFATAENQLGLETLSNGLTVALSAPAPNSVEVNYSIDGSAPFSHGTLLFAEGATTAHIPPPAADFMQFDLVQASLSQPTNAVLGDPSTLYLVRSAPPLESPTLITEDANWFYWDVGTDLGTAWSKTAYDHTAWDQGLAQLGFGESDQATTVNNNHQITTYFRHAFVVDDSAALKSLSMWLLRDDGAAVYLNGTEVFRSSNMPSGTLNYLSTTTANGENSEDTATLNTDLLQAGTNVVAVEIHQRSTTSSDISFDFKLTATPHPAPPEIYLGQFKPNVTIAWDGTGFVLEEAEQLEGPWVPVATQSPFIVAPNRNQAFYRLRQL